MIFTDVINFNHTSVSEQTLPALRHPVDPNKILMIFFGTHCLTSVTQMTNAAIFFGVSDGNGNQRSVAAYADDAAATTSLGVTQQNSHCGYLVNDAGAAIARFFFKRFDADANGDSQIVIEHQVDPNDMRFNCYAIYGSGIKNVKVGSFVVGAAGLNSVNVGFAMQDGDILIVFNSYSTNADNQSISATANIMMNIGMASAVAEQGYSSMFATDATTTGNLNATRQIVGKLFGFYDTTGVSHEAEFAGFTSTGFDYNMTTGGGGSQYMYYAVIRGGKNKVKNFNVPGGTGDNNHTGFDFTPISMFNINNSNSSSASTRVNLASFAIGAGKSATKAGACDFAYRSALDATHPTSEADDGQITGNALKMAEIGVVTNAYAIRKTASYKTSISYDGSAGSGGFTLTYGTSSTAREFLCWAIGDEAPTVNMQGKISLLGKKTIAGL